MRTGVVFRSPFQIGLLAGWLDKEGWVKKLQVMGCTMDDFWWYVNHTNMSAIFTTTHQWLDHPKIFSLPLGVVDSGQISHAVHGKLESNRSNLLLIAQSDGMHHRQVIAERVIANFNGTIKNRYKDGSDYYKNLRESKFILSPSGLGWDCYRHWEALFLGAIPIIETYNRKDGLYKTFDDLPVLWVEHFDNVTPALLEEAYPKILSKAREYDFAKLTKHWWAHFINSFRSDG